MSAKKKTPPVQSKVSEDSVRFQSKVIGLVLFLAFAGLSIFWFVGRSKLQSLEKLLESQAATYGLTVEKEPLSFSGFPFQIKGTFSKFKAFRKDTFGTTLLRGEPLEISTAFWKPRSITVKGPFTYGIYGEDALVVGLRVDKISGKISQAKDGETSLSDLQAHGVDLIRGENEQKLLSIKKVVIHRRVKEEGGLTRIESENEGSGIEIPEMPSSFAGVESISSGLVITSPHKDSEALMKAFSSFNKEFREEMRKRCGEKAEHLPSLKELAQSLENSKSSINAFLKIKGSEYGASLAFDGLVKNGFPELALTLEFKNVEKFLESAVEAGFLPANMARAVILFLANVSKAESGVHKVHLKLENRELKLGDKTVFELKDMDLDKLALPVQYCSQFETPVSEKDEAHEKDSNALLGLAAPVV